MTDTPLDPSLDTSSSDVSSSDPSSSDPSSSDPSFSETVSSEASTSEVSPWSQQVERVLAAIDDHVFGQRSASEQLFAAYLAGGHALLEGIPGIGKTLLARCFASALGLDFKRIQFTPDLMPADVLGTNIFDREKGSFRWMKGPIFTQILMADEINRTPPKTQAALLEGMQEQQVSLDGEQHHLDEAFFVVATQNPVEFEGTYTLPEAQLDRFLLRIEMTLPNEKHEIELYRRALENQASRRPGGVPSAVLAGEQAAELRRASRTIKVSGELLEYLHRLAAAVRQSPHLELAVSPRGALALLETARAFALLEGRTFAIPDDFKRGLQPCWGHRLILGAEAELEGHSSSRILHQLAESVEVPK